MPIILSTSTLVRCALVRSDGRPKCGNCSLRRVCYRLIAEPSLFSPDWLCAACSGITQRKGSPAALIASADDAPSVWDGVYEPAR